ncbi:molecular chaperone [Klebsiella michiganensis]|jgi:P pilus assembly chaperone PapD|uniref:Molecular chaperone n=6 Tax=Enterobacteriaceae TaxID=543 RepID=A0A0J2GS89_9ENTR|nr:MULTISPECIES: molecular chaperone [Klebsiella]AKL35270.1 long polar fimbrial chaperone LpfB [Klebsiella oxytoca]ARB21357.1 long polar fimbrial chaperone LpfB [Klebsiella oxytoca]AUW08957.1 long polar fimbrial chaperone LpfB [Klebsiella oxytoca]EKV5140010.1 molecular chaperone [Klebsiella michiganensis]EKW0781146.1 molecular chaperone [Klebsiella michiganensis]
MQKYLKVLIAGWLLVGAAAHAGVVTGGTRLIYPGGKKESSLSVTNNDATPYLIQSWVESNKGAAPFLLTPPLFRLEGEQQTRLRVIYSGGLPENKESMFWMNIKAIPSSQAKAGANTLQIAIKTRIKLIYRPKSIEGTPEMVTEQLRWTRSGNTLQVMNPTAFYMNFAEVKVGGAEVKEANWVGPGETARFQLPGVSAGALQWKLINDYGGTGALHHATL